MYELLGLAGENAVAHRAGGRAAFPRASRRPRSRRSTSRSSSTRATGSPSELFRCIQSQFQTPFDREDLVELVSVVDEVADKIENASELLGLYGVEQPTRQSIELCRCLVRATEELAKLLARLKGLRGSAEEIRTIKAIEDEADQVARNARAGLFKDDRIDPVLVIRWKDIYEALEDAVDACETAASRVGNILVKNAVSPFRRGRTTGARPFETGHNPTETPPRAGGRAPWRPVRGGVSVQEDAPGVQGDRRSPAADTWVSGW